MTRFVLTILTILSLIGASGPATAAASQECSMASMVSMGSGPAMDHEQMGCCTPDCAVTCPAAVLAAGDIEVPGRLVGKLPASDSVPDAPHSFNPGTSDPPPRVFA